MMHGTDVPPTRRGRLNCWLLALLALLPLVAAAAIVDGPNGAVYAIDPPPCHFGGAVRNAGRAHEKIDKQQPEF